MFKGQPLLLVTCSEGMLLLNIFNVFNYLYWLGTICRGIHKSQHIHVKNLGGLIVMDTTNISWAVGCPGLYEPTSSAQVQDMLMVIGYLVCTVQ